VAARPAFPGWGRAATLGAERIDTAPAAAEVRQAGSTWNEHPLRSLSGVTGRLAHQFSVPIWVGIWGLLGLAHHRVPPTGQARPSARLQAAKLDDLPQAQSAMGEYPPGI
jgi:hypothetical protein